MWAADYVLADYGTGAIMAVPAHDQRDLDFAKTFDLPVRRVVDVEGAEGNPEETYVATVGDGTYVNSGPLDGLSDKAAGIGRIIEQLEADGRGDRHRQLPAARLAAVPAALLGHADPDRALRRRAARCRCRTTSCRCGCPTPARAPT